MVVCKGVLVFRFGPRLGLKTEDLGQAEQKNYKKKVIQGGVKKIMDLHFYIPGCHDCPSHLFICKIQTDFSS